MARAKQPVSVADIEFDALIDSEEGYEADVPESPDSFGRPLLFLWDCQRSGGCEKWPLP